MNLVDGLKGSNVWFCVSVAIFGLAHGDDFAWQVQYFGCLKLISHGGRCAQYLVTFFRTSLCGVLVFDSVSRVLLLLLLSSSASAAPPLSHTIFVTHLSHTHFLTHHLCHTRSLSHSILVTHTHTCHTQLCHTRSLHTTLSHTIFVTHLSQTLSYTPFVTHDLCHTPSLSHIHTLVTHTTLSHTIFTIFHTHCVAGVALGDITPRLFAWQAALMALGWRHIPALCVAGVALMALGWLWWRAWAGISRRTPWHLAWQAWEAWHLATCAFVSRGRRGTWRQPPSFCVSGVAGSGGVLGLGLVADDAAHLA